MNSLGTGSRLPQSDRIVRFPSYVAEIALS